MKRFYFVFVMMLHFAALSQTHTYVRVMGKKNFTPELDSILNAALPLIDSVINLEEFRRGVLNAKFVRNQNLSNAEILTLLTSGREVHGRGANDTMVLILETYPDQNGDNIGTTYGSERIITSQAYIRRNGARCYAAHIIHEYCHTLGSGTTGFEHRHKVFSKKQRRQKCQSVPYIIGDLARRLLGAQTCRCECENYPQS